jgi:hypothetical protein
VGQRRYDDRTEAAIDWLLACDEPAVGRMARRDLRGEQAPPFTEGPWVRALLNGIDEPGHPYRKWVGPLADADAEVRSVTAAAGAWPSSAPRP